MPKSMLEIAYDYVRSQKEEVPFEDIWAVIRKELNLSDEECEARMARFYTNLMLDGRFVTLGENCWSLRERHTFDKVHIDMNDVYSAEDSESDVDAEDEEDIEYLKSLDGEKKEESDAESSDDEDEDAKDDETSDN